MKESENAEESCLENFSCGFHGWKSVAAFPAFL